MNRYKAAFITLLAVQCVALMGALTFGQSPTESPGATPFPFTSSLCVDVLGQPPVEGWNPTSLREALIAGTATLTGVGDPAVCAPTTAPTPEPTDTPQPTIANDDDLIVTTIDDGVQRVLDWSNSIQSMSSTRQLINAFVSIGTFAKQQVALDYTPSPCMESAWNQYRQGMSILHGKIVAFLRWIVRSNGHGSPPTSINDGFTRSGQLLGRARNEADSLDCSPSGISG